jgi:putative nucleotidyltransferase with HDIG domain
MAANPNSRIHEISKYVKNHLFKSYAHRSDGDKEILDRYLSNAEYRWLHTMRVAQFGKVIAENEGADIELIIAACILHDIAWFDTNAETNRDHGRLGAKKAVALLKKLEYSTIAIENICYSIASHVDVENPDTFEAKIVSDADNVDRFGPYRVLQWCYSDIEDYEKLSAKLKERITRLEHYQENNPLFTETGKQLFSEQLNLQIRFFSEFVGEKELSVIPRI